MKNVYLALVFALAGALVSFTAAQDTSSQNSSTAASTQTHSTNNSAVSSKSGAEDASLTQQVQNKFSQDPAFVNVQASVTNGTVLITGTVASNADKKRAKDLAMSISGVKHVKEQLSINPSAGASASKNNNQQDVNTGGSVSVPRAQSMSMPGATNPTSAETSATSTNPNSQASSVTGSSTSSSAMPSQTTANPQSTTQTQTPSTSQSPTTATSPATSSTGAPNTQTAPNASTQASGSAATGENASSLPQSNAAGEANMAGQTSTGAPSATTTPSTSGGVAGAATAPPASTSQSTTSTQSTTSGAIGANAGTPATPSMATTGVGVNDTATLQSQIQNALQNEPTLRNNSLSVNVTDNTIELGGAVQTGKEKQTAHRIASSFAGNRRVKDRITVSGHGAASTNPNSSPLGGNPANNSSNPQTNQNNPSNNPQNPSANNPAANGDASTNPR